MWWFHLVHVVVVAAVSAGLVLNIKIGGRRSFAQLHWFLLGLDGVYGSTRSNLLSQDPLLSMNRAYQSLIQEERLRGRDLSSEKKIMIIS